jgi:site-specific DNA-methyltransferase (adenine-specific)
MTTQAPFSLRGRNPDILSCIASLSNDEVFTPPEFANRMLDTVAEAWAADNDGANIWANSSVTFLDPCTKSGVFLREITSRLTEGLAAEIPDLQTRVNHILTKQVFGIGITRLTSLMARRSVYCSKHAQGSHSIANTFATDDGNIWYKRMEHTWVKGRCSYCGASEMTLGRGDDRENYAYAFIHSDNIKSRIAEMFGANMQFDVIIGNPPYQLASDGGTRDIPIYHRFIDQAQQLEPRYLAMVVPSRWMAGGLGLADFRKKMLSDECVAKIVDYPSSKDVFPGVEIKGGVCYFLWSRAHSGEALITTVREGMAIHPSSRRLDEFDVLVRDGRAIEVLRKILSRDEESITGLLSADKEFGMTSNYSDFHEHQEDGDIPLHYNLQGKRCVGYISRSNIVKSVNLIDKWKVMVPKAGSDGGQRIPDIVLGRPFIASSPSVCTQTYLFFYVESEEQAKSVQSYMMTRFFRFLVSLRKMTQDATRSTYLWVPKQSLDREWTDDDLYAKYGVTESEIEYINSMIRPMTAPNE